MQRKNINGEVRISLSTYEKLMSSNEESEQSKQRYDQAVDMLSDFLQFLGTKDYFKDISEEFNNSHDKLSIKRDPNDERVKIYLNGKKVQHNDS